MVGISLSGCVSSIVRGEIDYGDVEKIIASTAAPDDSSWEKVINNYKVLVWRKYPEQAGDIARRLWAQGKIEQPRLEGKPYPCLVGSPPLWFENEADIPLREHYAT